MQPDGRRSCPPSVLVFGALILVLDYIMRWRMHPQMPYTASVARLEISAYSDVPPEARYYIPVLTLEVTATDI